MLSVAAVTAVPAWFVLIAIVLVAAPGGSAAFNLAHSLVVPGFVAIAGVFVVGVLGMTLIRAAGAAGLVAATFVRMWGDARRYSVEGDAEAVRGLLPRLTAEPKIFVGLFLAITCVGVLAGVDVLFAYQATHGKGELVVTVGRDAVVQDQPTLGGTRYFLANPYGTALAEDTQPHDGQRWSIANTDNPTDKAFLVGGNEYVVLVGTAVVLAVLADAYLLVGFFRGLRRDRAARAAPDYRSLTHSVRRLSEGVRSVLRFESGVIAVIGMPTLHWDSQDIARLHVRRGRDVTTVVGVAVVVLAGVLATLHEQPVSAKQRAVSLPYLAATPWQTTTDVKYPDPGDLASINTLTYDAIADNTPLGSDPPPLGPIWSINLTARGPSDTAQKMTAQVTVADIETYSPARAVAGGVDKPIGRGTIDGAPGTTSIERVTGLPPDWAGLVIANQPSYQPMLNGVEVFGGSSGTLVSIFIPEAGSDAGLAEGARQLADAIANRGIDNFAQDIAP